MNWQRWIRPGLALTFILAVAAVAVHHGAVESDLDSRVRAALIDEGQGWAVVSASARDVTIKGTAPAPEAQKQAVAVAEGVTGVRAVVDASDLLPIVSPFAWSAHRQGSALALSGSVPSEGSRGSILAAARRAMPDAEITDDMKLARGAPPSFNTGAAFALGRLASLSDGVVSLTDGMLQISGTAKSADAFAAVRHDVSGSVPGGVAVAAADILPARADPFVLSASYDGKTLTLIGYVPNDAVHEALVATARAALPGVAISDSLALASGEPAHFAEAASFALAALSHLTNGGATLDGLNADITGRAKSIDDYEALMTSLTGILPAGLNMVAGSVEPAAVANYGWQAERKGTQVTLAGYVPSVEDRAAVSAGAAALFPGATVDNRVRVAAGEPRMDWIGAVKFAMGELAELSTGKVSVGDKSLSVEGEAASPEAYAALVDANSKTLPASLSLDKADIVPPHASPYVFRAVRANDGGIVISGNVANPSERSAILALAHRRFGAANIGGDLTYASGEPAGFVDAVGTSLSVLARLSGGAVEIRDKAITADGLTFEPAAVEGIADALSSGLPAGFSVAANTVSARQTGQPATPAECRNLIDGVVQTGGIAFDGASSDVSVDSIGLLDRIAAAMARCPAAHIEVGAFSDNEGTAARNRDRTQARAEAIVEFLVAAGVQRERLTAMGYGEDKPIADNGTDAGRAMNQRVEFAVALTAGG